MENLNNTHEPAINAATPIDAYNDFERWDIESRQALINSQRYTLQEALVDAFRLIKDEAHIDYNEMKRLRSLPESVSMEIAFEPFNCVKCGFQKEIIIEKSKVTATQVIRHWECRCGNTTVEVIDR